MKTLNLNSFDEFVLTSEEMINVRGGIGMIKSMPGQDGGEVIIIKI